jgi:predicted Zn-dependent protease
MTPDLRLAAVGIRLTKANAVACRQPGCGGEFSLAAGQSLSAWSDGSHVVVSRGMVKFAKTDDELAFVVAHEMAHNMLRHAEQLHGVPTGFASNFGSHAARIKRTEIEADSLAVVLMQRAGYDPDMAITFLKRAGKRRWWGFSTTHPGTGQRIKIVQQSIRRVPDSTAQKTPSAATANLS